MDTVKLPPEAGTIKNLNRIAGIIALIFGIILLVLGAIFLIIIIGVGLLLIGFIDLLLWNKLKNINRMIDDRLYIEAKEKQLVWVVIGFLFGVIIVGIILLLAYLKYDALTKDTEK